MHDEHDSPRVPVVAPGTAAVEGRTAPDVAPGAAPPPDPSDGPRGSTADAGVDEALRRLAELDDLPVRAHVAVFDAVHAALQDRLADGED